jgi:hypothetical protein
MKLYNPLRPHIVEFSNGSYAVRQLTVYGWQYYDNQAGKPDDYWWNSLEFYNHFKLSSYSTAKEVQSLALCSGQPKIKPVKVHL